MTDEREPIGARLEALAGRGLGALLALDERIVSRSVPTPAGPLDPDAFPWAAALRDGLPEIRAELDALLERGVQLPETDQLVGYDQGAEGRWSTYVLSWYGRWLDASCSRCPRTAALLRQVPEVQIAGFTVLDGGAHIPRHQGPARAIRWQMGVRVPEPVGSSRLQIGDEVIGWADGVTLAFDDRTEHEAWNDSAEPRYVLFVQVPCAVRGPAGLAHRATHRAFGRVTGRIARQAAALDRELNASR